MNYDDANFSNFVKSSALRLLRTLPDFIYRLKVMDEIQNKGKHVWKRNNMDRKSKFYHE